MSRMLLTGAVLSAALWGVATTLQAQTPEDTTISGLQEVTVTAQRREESVQDIPVVVSAFSPEQLEQRNIDSTLDLTQYVPNMIGHLNGGPGSAASYFIRGLGSTEIIATVDPPVGTYVDEIFIARQNANSLDLFDPERIEILRGPQGTLFGRNTTGGAVNVVLKKPAKVFGGNAEIGFGEYNRRIIAGSVDVPMAERFFTKLSAYYNDEDGYADNIVTGKKDNGSEQWGVRLATQTLVSDAVTWDLSGSYVY
ncbi:MAG: TonB-dependent receptor, partial [Gammaproteobacteria bacterium]